MIYCCSAAGLTFVVEAIDPINTCALMVPTQQEEVGCILDLVGEEEARTLKALLATIDVVSGKRVDVRKLSEHGLQSRQYPRKR
jgi:hypothetical protein